MINSCCVELNDQGIPSNIEKYQYILDWWQNMNGKTATIVSYPHPNYPDQSLHTKDKVKVKDINIQGNQLTWCQYDENRKAEIEQIALDKSQSQIIVLFKSKAKLEFHY